MSNQSINHELKTVGTTNNILDILEKRVREKKGTKSFVVPQGPM